MQLVLVCVVFEVLRCLIEVDQGYAVCGVVCCVLCEGVLASTVWPVVTHERAVTRQHRSSSTLVLWSMPCMCGCAG
jgi:hypothetical protein